MSQARKRSTPPQWQALAPRARDMRKDATPAETALWQQLRGRQIRSAKFRRQDPVGPFIVDFICVQQGLVVEVDGGIHSQQTRRDEERDAYLKAAGLRVLRVSNEDVLQRSEAVVAWIEAALRTPET